jgi:hypothetical protein
VDAKSNTKLPILVECGREIQHQTPNFSLLWTRNPTPNSEFFPKDRIPPRVYYLFPEGFFESFSILFSLSSCSAVGLIMYILWYRFLSPPLFFFVSNKISVHLSLLFLYAHFLLKNYFDDLKLKILISRCLNLIFGLSTSTDKIDSGWYDKTGTDRNNFFLLIFIAEADTSIRIAYQLLGSRQPDDSKVWKKKTIVKVRCPSMYALHTSWLNSKFPCVELIYVL